MSWEISKSFSCCYGHRVYVQELNQNYTGKDCLAKCRHLHGHEGLINVFLESSDLNDQAMVTDFKHLGWLKEFIDDTIDHKFIIDSMDPMFKQLVVNVYDDLSGFLGSNSKESFFKSATIPVKIPGCNHEVGRVVDLTKITFNDPRKEILEGYLIVDFVPTSENLSSWMWKIVQEKMSPLRVSCSKIEWYETPKSRATFVPSDDDKKPYYFYL